MKRLGAVAATALATLAAFSLARPADAAPPLSVSVNRAEISTALGHRFTFRSTITNHEPTPLTGLIAHLNVLSLRNGVYVDPEDWSSHRTRYLAPIGGGRSVTLTWTLQAVNAGSFGVYIAVLPQSGAARPPVTGPTLRVAIAHRETLDSGGALPLVVGIPALLAGLAFGVRARRRVA